jgi:hypothetical protein
MRFANTNLSYKILNCTIKKQNDMEFAFSIMENLTVLNFYPVDFGEDIFITCEEKLKSNGDFFIAGEGGPKGIISSGEYNVITGGEILLIKDSDCATPNVAIHELLHVLGFEHSSNSNNVMYNVTNCNQILSEDILLKINSLYSTPSLPDLILTNISASEKGTFLDINFTVMNYGLVDSEDFFIKIYSGDKIVKEINIDKLKFGQGRIFSLQNILTKTFGKNPVILIDSSFDEINKENNKIELKVSD